MHTLNKWFALVRRVGVPVLLGAGLLVSCSKERMGPNENTNRAQITSKTTQNKITEQARKMPAVGIYNKTMDKVIVFRQFQDGSKNFTFANPPSGGINFASSNGGQWTWSESQGLMIITEPGQSLGGGAGTVVAGSTVLDIAYAFCFSIGDDVLGGDLFDTGINEVAGVIGIAGDLEALMNGEFDEDDDLFQYFHGFAYYLVYADQLADQNYQVLNWIDDLDQDEADLNNFGFSYVVSFQNQGAIYLSKDGHLSVSGASIGFNGNYFGIEGLFFFDPENETEPTFVEVPGFGVMGCQ
jgi:hypothetical protein